LIVIVATGTSLCAAQSVSFSASVASNKVSVGEQFQLSFTLTSAQSVTPERFQPPDFNAFVVLSGPIQSSQYQWINGRTSSTLSYVYVIAARKQGKATIGPAAIELEGKSYKTEPIQIDVVPAAAGAQKAASGQASAQEIGENLYIKAVADKRRVRQGEQFILTYKLYTRVSIEHYAIAKAPTFEGFWAEDFDQPKSPEAATETVGGKQYRVATIKRTALFATQSGTLKITPLEVRCAVQIQTRRSNTDPLDIFNDPIFSNRLRTQEIDFTSNSLSITVDPLSGNLPAEFTGAVGSFTFDAAVDKKEVKTGDPVTLKLIVGGTGNLKLVAVPKPSFPGDIETYDPKVTEEIARDGNQIRGKKTAEYLLIPRNAGMRVIEPVSFVYYDLSRNTYVTLKSPRFVLNVAQGKDIAAGGTFASKEDVRLLGEDIRFLKLSPGSFRRAEEFSLINGWLIGGFVFPPLMFLGAFVYRKRQEKLLGNAPLLRSQKAGKEASRRLKTAEKLLGRGNTESYHSEISKALVGYLGDKLRIPRADLTLELAVETLKANGVPAEVAHQLQACTERAEFARFAPGADTQEARRDLLDQAKEVIGNVERALNR
ncbi:MAG: hypothetical protein A2052_09085, partial [Deltaproteobacteria bacterium GWA2_54_12]